jgi:ubiquinone/menaquinone biosynthesis C-methylase UbiE
MMYSRKAQRFVPLSTKQMASAVWNRTVQSYSDDIMPMFAPLHEIATRKACALLEGLESPHILDIGSAAGEPALSVALAIPDAAVVSTDFSGLAPLGGRSRAAQAGAKNIVFQFSDAEDLQFDDNSFDLVMCCLVLSVCDEEAVLDGIERILKPGGAVLLIDFGPLASADYLRAVHAAVQACVPEHDSLHHSFGMQPWRLGSADSPVSGDLAAWGFEVIETSSLRVPLDTGDATTDEQLWQRAKGPILALLETMRDMDQTDVKDEEALDAKHAFLAALTCERASGGAGTVASSSKAQTNTAPGPVRAPQRRWPCNDFRVWTARKPMPASRGWGLF